MKLEVRGTVFVSGHPDPYEDCWPGDPRTSPPRCNKWSHVRPRNITACQSQSNVHIVRVAQVNGYVMLIALIVPNVPYFVLILF